MAGSWADMPWGEGVPADVPSITYWDSWDSIHVWSLNFMYKLLVHWTRLGLCIMMHICLRSRALQLKIKNNFKNWTLKHHQMGIVLTLKNLRKRTWNKNYLKNNRWLFMCEVNLMVFIWSKINLKLSDLKYSLCAVFYPVWSCNKWFTGICNEQFHCDIAPVMKI